MILQQLDDGLVVHRIRTVADADEHRAGFVSAYRRIFADAPYHEDFTEEETTLIWRRLTTAPHHVTLVVLDGEELVALASAVPLTAAPDVARELHGLVPVRHTMYLAELGVEPRYRGRRLGRRLVNCRLRLIDRERYSHVVLRVADGNTSTFEMYRELDFADMGVSMQVRQRRTDGTVRADERHFMSRVLSQVPIADDA